MAGMFVPKMVPELDTLKAFQGIGKNLQEGIENRQRMDILSKVDASDPNSLTEAISRLRATGRLDDIYLADRLDQSLLKRQEAGYNRTEREQERGLAGERLRATAGMISEPIPKPPSAPTITQPDPHAVYDVDPDEVPAVRTPAPVPARAEGAPAAAAPAPVFAIPPRPATTPPVPPPTTAAPAPTPFPPSARPTPSPAPPASLGPGAAVAPTRAPGPSPVAAEPGGAPTGAPPTDVSTAARRPATGRPPLAVPPEPAPAPAASYEDVINARINRLNLLKSQSPRDEWPALDARIKQHQEALDAYNEPAETEKKLQFELKKDEAKEDTRRKGEMLKKIAEERPALMETDQQVKTLRGILDSPGYTGDWATGAQGLYTMATRINGLTKSLGEATGISIPGVSREGMYAWVTGVTKGPEIEMAKATMKGLAAAIIARQQGGKNISDADLIFAKEQTVNPNMSIQGAKRMLALLEESNNNIRMRHKIQTESMKAGKTTAEIENRLNNYAKSLNRGKGEEKKDEGPAAKPKAEEPKAVPSGGASGTTKSGINWSVK